MRILGVLVATLLGLAPLAAGAHGGHERESALVAPAAVAVAAVPEQLAPQEIAPGSPCPGGTEQSCSCRSLGGCRDGKAPSPVPGVSLVVSATRGIEIHPLVEPRASRLFPSSRPRAPPAFS
jgi:hypothetical protein